MKKCLFFYFFISLSLLHAGRARINNKSNGNIQIRFLQCQGVPEPIFSKLEERDVDLGGCCPSEVYVQALTGTAAPKAYTYRRMTDLVQSFCSDFTLIIDNTPDGKSLRINESVGAHYITG